MAHKIGFYEKYMKRPQDIVLSLLAIVVLCPVLLAVAILVKAKLGSPIIFTQDRPGLNEKTFKIFKFRTMTEQKDEKGKLLPDSHRLTKFGKILRSTSLDELPELFNILIGDMSFVGPRPLLTQYLPLYDEQQKRRHEVRPGLTGCAQVNGRNSISWEQKFSLDTEYVDTLNFVSDWKIIFKTLKKAFFREGINSETAVTMERFCGTHNKQTTSNKNNEIMKDKLLIIGAGGHGKVVADIAVKMNKWASIFFLDDDESIRDFVGIKVIGQSDKALSYINDCEIFVAVGNNAMREKFQEKLEVAGATIPILVHPNAVIGEEVELGAGTVVMAGVVINCCTKIGKGCIINTGATLDHDNVIEDYVHISPGTSSAGNVKVGKSSWICCGSVVSNNINICSSCIIGAGAVVVKDITEVGTYIGVPARKMFVGLGDS